MRAGKSNFVGVLVLSAVISGCSSDDTGARTAEGSTPSSTSEPGPSDSGLDAGRATDTTLGEDPQIDPEAAEFCRVLDERFESFEAGSSGGAADAFLALLNNISETNRLIASLSDVAPSSISVDMELVAADWQRQQEIVSRAAGDPLGAFAASLVSSVAASNSYAAVDAYALANCGRAVFGPSSTSAGSQPCQWIGGTDTSPHDRSPVTALEASLRRIVENSPAAGSDAGDLADQIARLEPPARYGEEAIVRLRLGGVRSVDLLRQINDAVLAECGVGIWDQRDVDAAFEDAVQPVGENRYLVGRFADCVVAGLSRPSDPDLRVEIMEKRLAGRRILYICETTGERAALDLDTGRTQWVDEPEAFQVGLTEDAVFFDREVRVAASGLEPEKVVESMVIWNTETGATAEILTYEGRADNSDRPWVSFVHGAGSNALLWYAASEDAGVLRVVSSVGETIAERAVACSASGGSVLARTLDLIVLATCDGVIRVDVRSGVITDLPDGSYRNNDEYGSTCRTSDSYMTRGEDTHTILRDGRPDPLVVTLPTVRNQYRGVFDFGSTVVYADDTEAFGFSEDGQAKWAYSEDDYNLEFEFVGEYLVATNEAGEQILINGETGEAVDASADVARTYADMLGVSTSDTTTLPDIVDVDLANNEIMFENFDKDEGTIWTVVPLDMFCPTAASG